jgi:hypothetical protein
MTKRDVEIFSSAVYDALESGASALVAVARGWSSLEKSYGAIPIYGFRPVLNAEEIRAHYVAHGVPEESMIPADGMHVTVVHSERAFMSLDDPDDWFYPGYTVLVKGGNRFTRVMGDGEKRALTLVVDSTDLVSEWNLFRALGASWKFEAYVPHVSVCYSYDGPEDVPPYSGDIVLGPLTLSHVDDDVLEKNFVLRDDTSRAILLSKDVRVIKTDDEQRIVWGWVSVATEKGERVFDSHGDHIPMEELEKASVDFMLRHRVGKAEHTGGKVSDVIGCLPLSADLAKALGVSCDREGLIMGFRVSDDDVWSLVKSGDFSAFSIGGRGRRVPL